MTNRFKISFEDADTNSALDGVSSDPANSNADVTGAKVDENKENKPSVDGDPTLTQENFNGSGDPASSNAEVVGVVTAEPKNEDDIVAVEDPAYKDIVAGTDPTTNAVIDEQDIDVTGIEVDQDSNDLGELGAALEELRVAVDQEYEDSGRILETCDNLYALGNQINMSKADDPIPTDVIEATAAMAVAGTGIAPEQMLSVESFKQNRELALEGLADKISAAISSIADGIITSAKNTINFIRYQLNFINVQKVKINALVRQISAMNDKKIASLAVSGNKFMVVGDDHVVKTKEEYVAELTKAVEFTTQLMNIVERFTRGNFLSKTKGTLGMLVPGVNYNKVFNELYANMRDGLLNPASQLKVMKHLGDEGTKKNFVSSPILGGGILEISTSTVELGSNEKDSSLDAKAITGAAGQLRAKFSTPTIGRNSISVAFTDVDSTFCKALIQKSLDVAKRIDSYNSFVMRWVNFWSGMSLLEKATTAPTPLMATTALTQMLFSVVRIVRLGAYMVFNLTASTFSYAKSMNNNNIRIISAFVNAKST